MRCSQARWATPVRAARVVSQAPQVQPASADQQARKASAARVARWGLLGCVASLEQPAQQARRENAASKGRPVHLAPTVWTASAASRVNVDPAGSLAMPAAMR